MAPRTQELAASNLSTLRQLAKTPETFSEFERRFSAYVRAGYQGIYVQSHEEARVENAIRMVGASERTPRYTIVWDAFNGFTVPEVNVGSEKLLKGDAAETVKMRNPALALEQLSHEINVPANAIFVFRDLDDFFQDPFVRRRIRSLTEGKMLVNSSYKRPLIITSSRGTLHEKLRNNFAFLEFNLPEEPELENVVEYLRQSVSNRPNQKQEIVIEEDLRQGIVQNLLGLTASEAENCLARCMVQHNGFNREMIATIKEEKAQTVKKSEVLTYIDETKITGRDQIAGFERYYRWLDKRKRSYSPAARQWNIDFPKGVVVIGIPGTGKSVVAEATCQVLDLPGYVLDIGAIFGSLVGESEQRMRDAIRMIESQKGCVVVADEIDKAFNRVTTSQGDSGVTSRIFGMFLSWLAAKKSRTFVIVTANRTDGLPPEFMRPGRFDKIFYTDVPNETVREQIIKIHLRKRGVDLAQLGFADGDWKSLAGKTQGFVGSELEALVIEARNTAFNERNTGNPTFDELFAAANDLVPMSTRDAASIDEIRKFCEGKAEPVCDTALSGTVPPGRLQGRVIESN